MGEGPWADPDRIGDIPDGEDALVGQAAQSAVGRDAPRPGLDVANRKIKPFKIRGASNRQQQMRSLNAIAIRKIQDRSRSHAYHFRPFAKRDSARNQRSAKAVGEFRIFL